MSLTPHQLHVYGPCDGPEGYSEVTRGFVHALDRMGVNVFLEPFEAWGPWSVEMDPEVGKSVRRAKKATLYPQPDPITQLHICLPEQVRPVESRKNVNFTMFEADRIPKNWVECSQSVDRVVVPNGFCLKAFQRSGIPGEKLKIVPLGYDPGIFNPQIPPLPLDHQGKLLVDMFPIRIMSVLEVTERKNLGGLLLAFFRLASMLGPSNCCLLLKAATYTGYTSMPGTIQRIRDHLLSEGKIQDLKYNVFNYTPLIPGGEMGAFLRVATHYLSMSLAEGWDMNAMNCMACGVPVIVPNHSGYTAYCDQTNACMIPVAIKVVADQPGALSRLYQDAHWFGPDADEAVPIIANYVTDTRECASRAHRALQDIQEFTWEKSTAKLLEALS